MKRASLLALLPLLGACRNNPYPLLESINKVELLYGELQLDESDYKPVEDQEAYGAGLVFLPAGTGAGAEASLLIGRESDRVDSGRKVEGKTWEVYGGLRYTYGIERLRPYFSIGLSYAELERDLVNRRGDIDDTNWGFYLSGGIDLWITDRIALGLQYRHMFRTDIELLGLDSDIDWDVWGVTLGFNF